MRLELTRPNGHYPLKVARLPIPPLLHNYAKLFGIVPRTGLEPARLSTLAPETSASTIPPPGHLPLSGKRGSNSRPQPWQGCALPTELFPRLFSKARFSAVLVVWKQNFPLACTKIPHYASFCKLKFKISKRAENEARTRDPNLGKVVLYQLSYFRVLRIYSLVSPSLAKVGTLIFYGKVCSTNWAISAFILCSFSITSPCQGWNPYLFAARCALPTELFPRFQNARIFCCVCCAYANFSSAYSKIPQIIKRCYRCAFRLTGAKVVLFFLSAKFLDVFYFKIWRKVFCVILCGHIARIICNCYSNI